MNKGVEFCQWKSNTGGINFGRHMMLEIVQRIGRHTIPPRPLLFQLKMQQETESHGAHIIRPSTSHLSNAPESKTTTKSTLSQRLHILAGCSMDLAANAFSPSGMTSVDPQI